MKLPSTLIVVALLISLNGCLFNLNQNVKKESYYKSLPQEKIQDLNFTDQNPITTKVDDIWYIVKRDGKAIPVMVDKGKPDRFKEGLIRVNINGKIGFVNRDLEIVIEPLYDFAFPFHKGISDICVGCREMEFDGVKLLDGGEWKRIDRKGLIVEE